MLDNVDDEEDNDTGYDDEFTTIKKELDKLQFKNEKNLRSMATLKEAIDQEFKQVSRAEVNQVGKSL